MPIYETIETQSVPVRVYATDLDDNTRRQLVELAESGLAVDAVAAMPDTHFGMGATIGSVFVSAEGVCPNAVGVDIGCGMAAVPIEGISAEDLHEGALKAIHSAIKKNVPTGFAMHDRPVDHELFDDADRSAWLERATDAVTQRQLGTLGGGNHFIELVKDESDGVWIMLHSGSRRIGKNVADHYQALARKQMEARGVTPRTLPLAYLLIDSDDGRDYLRDMTWCQHYAMANRHHMLDEIARIVRHHTRGKADWDRRINIHHNYCSQEMVTLSTGEDATLWVTRKGATSARAGQLGLIPGSMGVGSFIVRGLGNPLSWYSCSHGAGRRLSRSEAMRSISQHAFERSMEGIVAETVPELRDEAPQAYKDLTEVMRNQADLVEPVSRLLPLLNVKGVEGGRYRKALKAEKKASRGPREIEELTI